MSDIFSEMRILYGYYGFLNVKRDPELLNFRILTLLKEEFNETLEALAEKDAEKLVDGLIDLIVIAAGTLELFDVDGLLAWNRVYEANSRKKRGVKSTRPESRGIDLVKAKDWVGPSHKDNHGQLDNLFRKAP